MAALNSSKLALRREIKEKITNVSLEERKRQSEIVVKKLLNLPTFKSSKRVSVYLSIDSEVNTEPIVRKIFEEGKECFVPRYSKSAMQMVKLKDMHDWETLPVTSWKIKQPKLSDNREDALTNGGLDFVVMPGVCFTKTGLRLGHGGGYYDRFLADLKNSQQRPVATVAVAFKEQIVPDIPVTENDVKIDLVLTAED